MVAFADYRLHHTNLAPFFTPMDYPEHILMMYSLNLLGILCLRNDTVLGGDLEKNVGLSKNLPALVHLSLNDS